MKVSYRELLTARQVLEKMAGDTKAGMKSSLKIYKVLKELEFSYKEFADLRKRTIEETGYGELFEKPLAEIQQKFVDRTSGSIPEENMKSFQEAYRELLEAENVAEVVADFESKMEEIITEETECSVKPLEEADIATFSDLSSFDLINLGPFLKV